LIAFVVQAQIVEGKEAEWEASWRRNAPGMKNNPGHHFRHLMRSTEDPSRYLIYGLWDSEEQLRTALAKDGAKKGIADFTALTVDGPHRVVYEMVATDEDIEV